MRIRPLLLALGTSLTLAACGQISTTSGPPTSGTSAGPGSPPLRQETGAIAGSNSGNASAGTPSISGVRGDGRPSIDYSGSSSGGIGSPTPQSPPEIRQRARP
jgi:hypothetical protein